MTGHTNKNMRASDLMGRVTMENGVDDIPSNSGGLWGKIVFLLLLVFGVIGSVYVFQNINNASTDFLSKAAGQVVDLSLGAKTLELSAGEGINLPIVMHPDIGDVTVVDLRLSLDDVGVV